MGKPERLPSGNWRVRVYFTVDKKTYTKSFTASTKAEAKRLADEFQSRPKKSGKTLREVIEKYIELSAILSPTTLSAYRKIKDHAFPHIMDMNVNDLTDSVMQQAINQECRRTTKSNKPLSAKTVKNEWGLVSSALNVVCNLKFNVRLPKVQHKNTELPNPKIIIDSIKGTSIELPCLLAMWCSLRMSEIKGLMCSSIKRNTIFVDSVMVDVDGVETRKSLAKTDKSIRKVYLPQYVKALAEKSENYLEYKNGNDCPLISLSRDQIYYRFTNLMQKQGIKMTFHDLRHIYASVSLNILNIPERFVMDSGGWATPSVMKSVYSQSFSEARRKADETLETYFDSLL